MTHPTSDHSAFGGYYAALRSAPDMLLHIEQVLDDIQQNGSRRRVTKLRTAGARSHIESNYPDIWLADTFFSDTIPGRVLLKMLRCASTHQELNWKMIFVNPLCDQARIRAIMLEAGLIRKHRDGGHVVSEQEERILQIQDTWPSLETDERQRRSILDDVVPQTMIRFCRGLELLTSVLDAHRNGVTRVNESERIHPAGPEIMKRVVELLKGLSTSPMVGDKPEARVQIRFTSDLSSLPTYIVGPFCYKGMLLPNASSVTKPWSIYRDDHENDEDHFELSQDAFNQAWQNSIPLPTMQRMVEDRLRVDEERRTVWIAYSEKNRAAMEQIRQSIDELRLNIRVQVFPVENRTGDLTWETVEQMLRNASCGIALLMGDEEWSGPSASGSIPIIEKRTRPNVIHEVGLMQSRFGRKRTFLLADKDPTLVHPSNLAGMRMKSLKFREGRFRDDELKGVLHPFLTEMFNGTEHTAP